MPLPASPTPVEPPVRLAVLLEHLVKVQESTQDPQALIAAMQAMAAISMTDPALQRACFSAIDREQVNPLQWAQWAIRAEAPQALATLFDLFGMDPFDRTTDGEPLFSLALSENRPVAWAFFEQRGVPLNHRWDDAGATSKALPLGPLTLMSMAIVGHAFALVLDLLDRPSAAAGKDLLDHALYTLMAERALYSMIEREATRERLDVLRRLLDLGADPTRVFPFQEERYARGVSATHRQVRTHRATLGWSAAHWALYSARSIGDPVASQSCESTYWALLADRVDWSALPPDSFGRTPLALVLELPRIGEASPRTPDSGPDADLGWHGQWLVEDLMARGARLVGANPDWEPVRLAWSNGAEDDRWGPFWALCRHHRDSGSDERVSPATLTGLIQDWAQVWGTQLARDWPRLPLATRQARAMEQNARARALVQWVPDEVHPVFDRFMEDARHELKELMDPAYNTPAERERFGAQASLLAETWALRAEICLHQPAGPVEHRSARPRL